MAQLGAAAKAASAGELKTIKKKRKRNRDTVEGERQAGDASIQHNRVATPTPTKPDHAGAVSYLDASKNATATQSDRAIEPQAAPTKAPPGPAISHKRKREDSPFANLPNAMNPNTSANAFASLEADSSMASGPGRRKRTRRKRDQAQAERSSMQIKDQDLEQLTDNADSSKALSSYAAEAGDPQQASPSKTLTHPGATATTHPPTEAHTSLLHSVRLPENSNVTLHQTKQSSSLDNGKQASIAEHSQSNQKRRMKEKRIDKQLPFGPGVATIASANTSSLNTRDINASKSKSATTKRQSQPSDAPTTTSVLGDVPPVTSTEDVPAVPSPTSDLELDTSDSRPAPVLPVQVAASAEKVKKKKKSKRKKQTAPNEAIINGAARTSQDLSMGGSGNGSASTSRPDGKVRIGTVAPTTLLNHAGNQGNASREGVTALSYPATAEVGLGSVSLDKDAANPERRLSEMSPEEATPFLMSQRTIYAHDQAVPSVVEAGTEPIENTGSQNEISAFQTHGQGDPQRRSPPAGPSAQASPPRMRLFDEESDADLHCFAMREYEEDDTNHTDDEDLGLYLPRPGDSIFLRQFDHPQQAQAVPGPTPAGKKGRAVLTAVGTTAKVPSSPVSNTRPRTKQVNQSRHDPEEAASTSSKRSTRTAYTTPSKIMRSLSATVAKSRERSLQESSSQSMGGRAISEEDIVSGTDGHDNSKSTQRRARLKESPAAPDIAGSLAPALGIRIIESGHKKPRKSTQEPVVEIIVRKTASPVFPRKQLVKVTQTPHVSEQADDAGPPATEPGSSNISHENTEVGSGEPGSALALGVTSATAHADISAIPSASHSVEAATVDQVDAPPAEQTNTAALSLSPVPTQGRVLSFLENLQADDSDSASSDSDDSSDSSHLGESKPIRTNKGPSRAIRASRIRAVSSSPEAASASEDSDGDTADLQGDNTESVPIKTNLAKLLPTVPCFKSFNDEDPALSPRSITGVVHSAMDPAVDANNDNISEDSNASQSLMRTIVHMVSSAEMKSSPLPNGRSVPGSDEHLPASASALQPPAPSPLSYTSSVALRDLASPDGPPSPKRIEHAKPSTTLLARSTDSLSDPKDSDIAGAFISQSKISQPQAASIEESNPPEVAHQTFPSDVATTSGAQGALGLSFTDTAISKGIPAFTTLREDPTHPTADTHHLQKPGALAAHKRRQIGTPSQVMEIIPHPVDVSRPSRPVETYLSNGMSVASPPRDAQKLYPCLSALDSEMSQPLFAALGSQSSASSPEPSQTDELHQTQPVSEGDAQERVRFKDFGPSPSPLVTDFDTASQIDELMQSSFEEDRRVVAQETLVKRTLESESQSSNDSQTGAPSDLDELQQGPAKALNGSEHLPPQNTTERVLFNAAATASRSPRAAEPVPNNDNSDLDNHATQTSSPLSSAPESPKADIPVSGTKLASEPRKRNANGNNGPRVSSAISVIAIPSVLPRPKSISAISQRFKGRLVERRNSGPISKPAPVASITHITSPAVDSEDDSDDDDDTDSDSPSIPKQSVSS